MGRGGGGLHQTSRNPTWAEETMIHLAWPWMALLLPLPWLHYLWRTPAEPGGSIVFVPMAANLAAASPSATTRSRWGRLLFAALWLLLIAAAVRPQWLGDPQPAPTTGRRLMLAIDVSGSMAT